MAIPTLSPTIDRHNVILLYLLRCQCNVFRHYVRTANSHNTDTINYYYNSYDINNNNDNNNNNNIS